MSELLWRQAQASPLAKALADGDLLKARQMLATSPVDTAAINIARLLDDPGVYLLLQEKNGASPSLLVGSRLGPWLASVHAQQRAEALDLRLLAETTNPASSKRRF
jgi:hypothetical protein